MRTIIAGSRHIIYYDDLLLAIEHANIEIATVISGTAKGVDQLGERWAKENNIPLEQYPAQWDKYGKSAGYKRNEQMAKLADAALILWDKKSRGTKHMINLSKKYGLHTLVYTL